MLSSLFRHILNEKRERGNSKTCRGYEDKYTYCIKLFWIQPINLHSSQLNWPCILNWQEKSNLWLAILNLSNWSEFFPCQNANSPPADYLYRPLPALLLGDGVCQIPFVTAEKSRSLFLSHIETREVYGKQRASLPLPCRVCLEVEVFSTVLLRHVSSLGES